MKATSYFAFLNLKEFNLICSKFVVNVQYLCRLFRHLLPILPIHILFEFLKASLFAKFKVIIFILFLKLFIFLLFKIIESLIIIHKHLFLIQFHQPFVSFLSFYYYFLNFLYNFYLNCEFLNNFIYSNVLISFKIYI